MLEEENTPDSEVNESPDETVNDEQDTVEDTDETVSGLHDDTEKKKVPDTIPKARLDKEIQRRKELEKQLDELKQEKDTDDSVTDTDKDPDVKELAQKLANIEEKEKQARREQIFGEHLNKALENAPEYKDIVNVEVIKQMAFNPANKDKTYKQLLEEAYGNALSGKRTIETATHRGGAKDTKVDVARAQQDSEYRKQVLADPELRKQYNVGIEHRINL